MRTFIAVDIPKEIKSEVAKIQSDLKKVGVEARWVKPENFHLTVAFLGLIDEKQVTRVKGILTPINRFIEKPFNLQLEQISAFPHLNKARVVFVDLSGETEKLKTLAVKVRNELKNKKIWFDEKPFVAHITLGRFKKPQNLTSLIEKINIKKISFAVKEASLYQSQLSSSGSTYIKL
jgi:2'-5' RNA ligase